MKSVYVMIFLTFLLSSCNYNGSTASRGRELLVPYTPDISINEIMVAQIDHAAHEIWNAANPDNDIDDIDWMEVEHHAIQLISSRSAMTMGGAGVNDAMWIAQATWRDITNDMNEASLAVLAAAKARSTRDLEAAGDYLVETCEGCHRQYKPAIPTEGVMHPH